MQAPSTSFRVVANTIRVQVEKSSKRPCPRSVSIPDPSIPASTDPNSNSALSEFLRVCINPPPLALPTYTTQERGINAADIRARAQAAALQQPGTSTSPPAATTRPSTRASSSAAASSSRASASVEVKTKKGKRKAKGKRKRDDSDGEEAEGWNPYSKPIPVPGQIAFCAECESRFTVTAYSRAAEGGDGLLCTSCGKKFAKEDKEVKRKRANVKKVKRDVLRQALDGESSGPKSLKEYCIRV